MYDTIYKDGIIHLGPKTDLTPVLKGDEAMSIMMMMFMDLFVTFTFYFLAGCSVDCCAYWIEATDVAKEGTFIWTSDNSTVGFGNWYPGEPNNYNNEDCVNICRNEHWNDADCNRKYSYICQTPAL